MEGYAAASVAGGGASSGPSRLSAAQLGRLHAVLSPFMLRRVKADVLEVRLWCSCVCSCVLWLCVLLCV